MLIKISGAPEKAKTETQEKKIMRRLTNMGFSDEEKKAILELALVHPEQSYMLRCSRETFYEMLPNDN